jgi:hypothetical protein
MPQWLSADHIETMTAATANEEPCASPHAVIPLQRDHPVAAVDFPDAFLKPRARIAGLS